MENLAFFWAANVTLCMYTELSNCTHTCEQLFQLKSKKIHNQTMPTIRFSCLQWTCAAPWQTQHGPSISKLKTKEKKGQIFESIFCTRWTRLLVARGQASEASDSGDLQLRKDNEMWIFQEMANGYLVFLKLGKATQEVHNPGDQLCRAARPWSWQKATFPSHTDDHPLPWLVSILSFGCHLAFPWPWICFMSARALMTIKFDCTNER